MKKTDLLLIVLALVAAAGIYFYSSAGAEKGLTAVVTVDGVKKGEFPLDTAMSTGFHTEWGYNFVHVEYGQVWITEADCRDQICVEHKRISRVGETIVCLPHKLVVEIIGEGEEAFDMVVG